MKQLINGFNDMMKVLVIHRDLKLQNIMLHFPEMSDQILGMRKQERRNFLATVDLTRAKFEIKIADFGFSKKLRNKS